MKIRLLYLSIVLIFSCQSMSKPSNSNQPDTNSIKRKWMLISLNNISKNKLIKHKVHIDLSHKNNSGTAFAGCNNIGFTYKTGNNSSINFTDIATTRMYCEDTNKIESSLLSILNTCKKYKIEGHTLYLTTTSNHTIKCIAQDWD